MRITSASSATSGRRSRAPDRRATGASASRRPRPTSTRPPAGPDAKDSGASSIVRAVPPSSPMARRIPASVPEASWTPSSRYHAPGAAARATPGAGTGRWFPRRVRGGRIGGRATGPVLTSAIAASGTRPRIHRRGSTREYLLRRGSMLAGGGRERHGDDADYRPLIPERRWEAAAGGTLIRATRGLSAPPEPTRFGREAGVIPAQSRYGDRPMGRKSGRRPAVAARAFERKVRRTVRSTA